MADNKPKKEFKSWLSIVTKHNSKQVEILLKECCDKIEYNRGNVEEWELQANRPYNKFMTTADIHVGCLVTKYREKEIYLIFTT
eukprot:UN01428